MPNCHPDEKSAFLKKFQVKRNLKKPNHGTPLIMYNSAKNQASMYANSHNEKWCYSALEWDDFVVAFVSQPLTVKYLFEGKVREYTPDLLVHYADGAYKFLEIKDERGLGQSDFKEKFPTLQKHYRENIGIELDIMVREQELPGHSSTNIEILKRYSSVHLDENRTQQLIKGFTDKEFSFAQILESAKLHNLDSAYVCALMAQKKITFDLSKPLSPQMILKIA